MSNQPIARIALVVVLVAAVVAATLFLPVTSWLLALVDWVRQSGPVGVAVFAVVYVAAAALLLPGSLLTIGAGFAWGPLWGTLLVSPVSVLAATVAFVLGRSVARGAVAKRLDKLPRFAAIDEAVAHSGFKIVLLLRLSPIVPFNLLNYALGLTRVRLRDYVVASFLGMLPGTALYVYLGSLVTSTSELLSGRGSSAGTAGHVLYAAGLVATVAVTVLVTRLARQALQRALPKTPTEGTP